MQVLNVHERRFDAAPKRLGALLDSLASDADQLWPKHWWPRMAFDRPLGVGARGGHGPIRYVVEHYTPAESITFRFTGPNGFNGVHGYEIVASFERSAILRHTLRMRTHGLAIIAWPLVYRPLHDALIEDSLTRAQVALGHNPTLRAWSRWVRLLRWMMSGGKAPPQVLPNNAAETRSARQRHP